MVKNAIIKLLEIVTVAATLEFTGHGILAHLAFYMQSPTPNQPIASYTTFSQHTWHICISILLFLLRLFRPAGCKMAEQNVDPAVCTAHVAMPSKLKQQLGRSLPSFLHGCG